MTDAEIGGIFVCARRGESRVIAGRLVERLRDRFGADLVFSGATAPSAGSSPDEVAAAAAAINDVLIRCRVLVLVIGRHWIDGEDATGRRRLDDPQDEVRVQVQTALRRGIPIIPVLTEGVRVPRLVDLPSSMAALVNRKGVLADNLTFREDVRRLIRAVERLLATTAPMVDSAPKPDVAPGPSVETDQQATDPQATDPQATDPQATDPQAVDPKAADPKAADPKAADTKPAGIVSAPARRGPRTPVQRWILVSLCVLLVLGVGWVIYEWASPPAAGSAQDQSETLSSNALAETSTESPASSPTSPAASLSATEAPSTAATTSARTDAGGLVTLDAPTTAWFTTICQGQRDLERLATSIAGATLAEAKRNVQSAYLSLSTSAARTVAALNRLAPPTVADPVNNKRIRIAQFTAIADGYRTAAAEIAAFDATSEAALKGKVDESEATIKDAVTKAVESATPLPDDYQSAVQSLPACSGLLG